MYDNTTIKAEQLNLLDVRNETCKGENFKYYFYSLNTYSGLQYYAVEISTGLEGDFSALGSEYEFAYSLYGKIADGIVTPLTLREIVFDAFAEKKY